jgi:TolB protein
VPPPTAAGTQVGSGGRLAFISDRDGQHFQIYTMYADGSDVQPLTTDPTDKWDPNWTFGGTQLAFSPDGTRLLYVAASPAGNGTDLWLINVDGSGAPVNLTAAPGDDSHPTWCADGSIWFTSLRANNTHQIFTTTLADYDNGLRPRNISGTHNYPREFDPVLLPEGGCQRLLFVTTLGGQRPQIWRYFLDCPNCYRVVRTEQDLGGAAEEPAVSADGLHLAYTRRVGEAAEIMVGEVLNRLVNVQVTDTQANFQPQFSPDGRWLVFTSARDGQREIYRMAVDGTGQSNLTLLPATDTDPVWQPVAVP